MKTEPEEKLYQAVEKKILEHMDQTDNTRLLPENELSTLFEVSRTTITKALNNLEKKGLLRKRKGHGNFVLKSVLNETMSLNSGADFARIIARAGYVPTLVREIQNYNYPNRTIREKLNLTLEDLVLTINYGFYADERKAIHTIQHIPKAILKSVPSDDKAVGEEIEQWDFFKRYTDQVFSHVIFHFIPTRNPEMAGCFELHRDTCLLKLSQKSYNIYDQVIACSEIYMNPEIMPLSLATTI